MLQTRINQVGKGAKANRKDVARAAGVSLTTVTHALNPVPGTRVKEKTRERVRRVARELGYRPSFVGRALVSGKTYTVGVLQPSHRHLHYSLYQGILLGMVEEMAPADYHPLLLFRGDGHRFLDVIRQGRVDGLVILQSDLATDHIVRAAATGIPVVVANKDYPVDAYPNLGCVEADHWRLMAEVVAEFANLGCRTILEVNDHRDCDANHWMFEAFVAAIEARRRRGLAGTTMIPASGRFGEQMRTAFASGQRWDGIFVDGIHYAEDLLAEAKRAGLKVGRDFHLITSDVRADSMTRSRTEAAAYNMQPEQMGRECWRLLKNLMAGPPPAGGRRVLVPYRRLPGRGEMKGKTRSAERGTRKVE